MTIKLSDFFGDDPKKYKAHLAVKVDGEPLDDFVQDKEAWMGWQELKRGNRFERDYIFSLMRFYPESDDIWLFGGIFEVVDRSDDMRYKVKLDPRYEGCIGRLKIQYKNDRNVYPNLENCIDEFIVSEVLKEEYSGK